jgi:predicted metallopeptidase
MGIKYFQADDIKERALDIVKTLNWTHIDFDHLGFLRSTGSSAPRTIARCHALGKAMQMAMGRPKGFYLIEVISENFDKRSYDDQTNTIIHELLHIPKTFGGGFIHHDMVHERNVKKVFDYYINLKKKQSGLPSVESISQFDAEEIVLDRPEKKPEMIFIKRRRRIKWF